MSSFEAAPAYRLEADVAMQKLVEHVLKACEEYGVRRRHECVSAFVMLAARAKRLLAGDGELSSKRLERFKEIRDLAGKLKDKLAELDGEEFAELEHCNMAPLDLTYDFGGALETAARCVAGLKSKRDVVECIGKEFVILCHEFQIAVRWSKSLENCSEYCSARLLGAVFEASRIPFNPGGEQRTASDSANNCLSKLSKGFAWEFHWEHYDSESVVVYLDKIVHDQGIQQLPRKFTP